MTGRNEYLIRLYQMSMNNPHISSAEFARKIGISKATAHNIMQRLMEQELVVKEHYSKVIFTQQGLELAQQLYQRYQMFYLLFCSGLTLSKEEANQQAFVLVNHLSEEVQQKCCQRIASGLGQMATL